MITEDLKTGYPNFPNEMAIVLRGMMTAELRRRTSLTVPAVIAEAAGVPHDGRAGTTARNPQAGARRGRKGAAGIPRTIETMVATLGKEKRYYELRWREWERDIEGIAASLYGIAGDQVGIGAEVPPPLRAELRESGVLALGEPAR